MDVGALNETAIIAKSPNGEGNPDVVSFARAGSRLVRRVRRTSGSIIETDAGSAPLNEDADLAAAADANWLRLKKSPEFSVSSGDAVTIVDLFAGCGALTLGALEAARVLGLRVVLSGAADSDQSPLDVMRTSLDLPKTSVQRINLEEALDGHLGAPVTSREREFLEGLSDISPSLLLAGPPCQGHSPLNNHTRHDDDRNDLYLRVVRYAELSRPRYCLIENVGTVMRDQRQAVERAIEHLSSLGYQVDHSVIPLNQLGVPQKRRRHILVAAAEGEQAFEVNTVLKRHSAGEVRTVEWAIGDLEDTEPTTPFDQASHPSAANALRMNLLHQNDWDDLPNEHRPDCHRLPKTGPTGELREHTYKSMYGRLRWDQPAQTVTSGYGSMGQGRYVHPSRPRTLTPHEAARLQFFPDFYRFDVIPQRKKWATMIGNAAPMRLSFAFALEILR